MPRIIQNCQTSSLFEGAMCVLYFTAFQEAPNSNTSQVSVCNRPRICVNRPASCSGNGEQTAAASPLCRMLHRLNDAFVCFAFRRRDLGLLTQISGRFQEETTLNSSPCGAFSRDDIKCSTPNIYVKWAALVVSGDALLLFNWD